MNLRALKGHVIIESLQPGNVTAGGLLVVPGTAKRQSGCLGTVVSSGVDGINNGDRVAFESIWAGDYALRYRMDNGRDLYAVEEKRVLAIIEDAIECKLCGELSSVLVREGHIEAFCKACSR